MLFPTFGRRRILPRVAVQRSDAGSWPAIWGANEAVEHLNPALGVTPRVSRCAASLGDPACRARVFLTHAEYEPVRASGSHFAVAGNHENLEGACVLSEDADCAVFDVVAGDARYPIRVRNPRHAWVDSVIVDDAIGQPRPAPDGSAP